MKRFFLLIMLITIGASVVGCYDDSKLQEDMADLQKRVSALELLCSQMNNNIVGMQTIINVLNNNDYITAVTPIKEGDKEIGYTISFLKGDPITIYHGHDGSNGTNGTDGFTPLVGIKQDTDGVWYWTLNGDWLLDDGGKKVRASGIPGDKGDEGDPGITPLMKIVDGYWYVSMDNGNTWTKLDKATGENGTDGSTPEIGTRQDTDGVWYWTINGEWLLDENGQKVRASGTQGEKGDTGASGITPLLKIEDDYWYISIDNGETWTKLSKAKGEDGDAFFDSVDSTNEGFVVFKLIDGTIISVPKYKQLSLILDSTSEDIASGETIDIGYTISGSGSVYEVQCFSQTGWHAEIHKETVYSGTITITAPADLRDGSVMIIVNDEFGNVVIRTIQLIASEGSISIGKEEYSINNLGGNLDIIADSNVDLTVIIPTEDQSWIQCISVAKTKALVPYTVRIHIDENQGYDDRSSTILLRTKDGCAEKSITINQFQKNAIVLPSKSFEISYMNQSLDIPIQSNIAFTVSTDSDWLRFIQTKALVDKLATIDVTMNTDETVRNGHIKIKNTESGIEQVVTVTQTGFPTTLFSIPDTNFKEYLLSKYDINMDGEVSTNEAAKVSTMDCSGRSITSIEGINYFINLKSLNCSNNSIVNLSLTINSLTSLYCQNNAILSLDIKDCTSLETFDCSNNGLQGLDLSNNSSLKNVSCYGNPAIKSLNLSNLGKIESLFFAGSSVNALNNATLSISNSNLRSFVCRNLQAVKNYSITNNKALQEIDVTNNSTINSIDCSDNALESISIDNNATLKTLICSGNVITNLPVNQYPYLQNLNCSCNKISTLNLSTCQTITTIDCSNNLLQSINLSNNPLVTTLVCSNNDLQSLDISNCLSITELQCVENSNLTSIIIDAFCDPKDFNHSKDFTALFADKHNKIHYAPGDFYVFSGTPYVVFNTSDYGKTIEYMAMQYYGKVDTGITYSQASSYCANDGLSLPSVSQLTSIYSNKNLLKRSFSFKNNVMMSTYMEGNTGWWYTCWWTKDAPASYAQQHYVFDFRYGVYYRAGDSFRSGYINSSGNTVNSGSTWLLCFGVGELEQ